jgi:hypothetical protein
VQFAVTHQFETGRNEGDILTTKMEGCRGAISFAQASGLSELVKNPAAVARASPGVRDKALYVKMARAQWALSGLK